MISFEFFILLLAVLGFIALVLGTGFIITTVITELLITLFSGRPEKEG